MNNVKNLCQWQQFIGRWLPKRVEKCCQELAAAERFTVDTSWAQVEDTNSLESWEVPLVFRCLMCQVSIVNIFPGWDYIWLYHGINIVWIYIYLFIYLFSSVCKFLSFEDWRENLWLDLQEMLQHDQRLMGMREGEGATAMEFLD